MLQRVGRSRGWRRRLLGVNLAGAAHGADLGGSSKYLREADLKKSQDLINAKIS